MGTRFARGHAFGHTAVRTHHALSHDLAHKGVARPQPVECGHTRIVEVQRPAASQPCVFLAVVVDVRRDGVGGVRATQQHCVRAVEQEEEADARPACAHVARECTDAIALAALRAGAEQLPWRLHLIKDDEIVNAFALPNGHIYVCTRHAPPPPPPTSRSPPSARTAL